MHPSIELSCELMQRASVTPDDAGCQAILIQRLVALGFICETLRFGDPDAVGEQAEVVNLWATYGETGPRLCYAAHTDVVPTGDLAKWQHDPFSAQVSDGVLHGRGASDMKTSIAAFVVALERLFARGRPKGRIALLITSDEEGPSLYGTRAVVEELTRRGEVIDYCLVGEPSSTKQVGDVIKNGRRGSLGGVLTVQGKQGHVAYPQLADNPIHRAMGALAKLLDVQWDSGNDFFDPTSLQISNINSGTGATNVIPDTLTAVFNFRFSTETTKEALIETTESVLKQSGINFAIDWKLSGEPFLTRPGKLVDAAVRAVESVQGFTPELSTSGGTSDGRFIAPMGAQVLELGVQNTTIHQINEQIEVSAVETLTDIYEQLLINLQD